MRILFLSHCLPYPPNKGERIRAFHQLRQLALNHEVHLLALRREGSTRVPEELANLCASAEVFSVPRLGSQVRSALGLFNRSPLTYSHFHSPRLFERLRELRRNERFDVVVGFTVAMVPYVRAFDGGAPWVVDMVDVDSEKWEQYGRYAAWPVRWIYRIEADRMRRVEAGLSDFSEVLLTTSREVDALRSFAPKLEARVAGTGICMDTYRRLDMPRAKPPSLVFTGQMDYFANVDGVVRFARGVFPRLREKFRGLEFVIVGRSPSTKVLELEEIPGVVVTGAVADVKPFLARASVFVAPLRIARGLQTKILEAMASELPVVCSDAVGAGLVDGGFEPDHDLIVGRNWDEFEAGVCRLLEDEGLRHQLSRNAHEKVHLAYSLEAKMLEFEHLVAVAAKSPLPANRVRRARRKERIA